MCKFPHAAVTRISDFRWARCEPGRFRALGVRLRRVTYKAPKPIGRSWSIVLQRLTHKSATRHGPWNSGTKCLPTCRGMHHELASRGLGGGSEPRGDPKNARQERTVRRPAVHAANVKVLRSKVPDLQARAQDMRCRRRPR